MKNQIPRIIPDPGQMSFDFGDGWGDVAGPARRSRRPWAHAMTSEAARRILAPDWPAMAARCKARFGHRCAVCYTNRNLDAHHRTYVRLWHERDDDLTCLCDTCHELFHRHGRWAANDGHRREAA